MACTILITIHAGIQKSPGECMGIPKDNFVLPEPEFRGIFCEFNIGRLILRRLDFRDYFKSILISLRRRVLYKDIGK